MTEKTEPKKFPTGFVNELWDNLPKILYSAQLASGLSKKEFITGWAHSMLWAKPHRGPKAFLPTTAAMELWNSSMSTAMWKGAALVFGASTKVDGGHTGLPKIKEFLLVVATDTQEEK